VESTWEGTTPTSRHATMQKVRKETKTTAAHLVLVHTAERERVAF